MVVGQVSGYIPLIFQVVVPVVEAISAIVDMLRELGHDAADAGRGVDVVPRPH